MIPVVGNHIVKLGNGQNITQKFNRLFIFYKEVMSRTGFNKYKTIDVRYAGQVIGGKSENPKVDSVLLRKSVEKMLDQIKIMEAEAMKGWFRFQSQSGPILRNPYFLIELMVICSLLKKE